ncbi:PilZ domain-containing protein [Thalassotalea crassostreae]|uniref:PilZ domain-containing protein n=1 Tax=Thalassotalea crassostreae TaxID=1763536 RepID=UPI0008390AD3|nr:PilZ domain-containing protein [Thalassotalea crassostreae]
MTDPKIDLIERRRSFRIDMENEPVDISWHDRDGQAHKIQCPCADFSKGGLRIIYDFAIAEDTEVTFKFQADHPDSQSLTAKVVRCNELTDGKFSIGFQLL